MFFVLEARVRVLVVGVGVAVAVTVVVAAAAVEEEEEERRGRLVERDLGDDEEDEGAAEEASARFRLRVSIQKPNHRAIRELAHDGALITRDNQLSFKGSDRWIESWLN